MLAEVESLRFVASLVSAASMICLSSCSPDTGNLPIMTLWKIAPSQGLAKVPQRAATPDATTLGLGQEQDSAQASVKLFQRKFKLVGGSDIIVTDKLPLAPSLRETDIPIEPDVLGRYNPGGMLAAMQYSLKVRVNYQKSADKQGNVEYRVKAIYPVSEQ